MLMNIVVPEAPGVMFKTCEPGYLACHPQTYCKLLISPESLCSFYVLRGGGASPPLWTRLDRPSTNQSKETGDAAPSHEQTAWVEPSGTRAPRVGVPSGLAPAPGPGQKGSWFDSH